MALTREADFKGLSHDAKRVAGRDLIHVDAVELDHGDAHGDEAIGVGLEALVADEKVDVFQAERPAGLIVVRVW